jgi:hypothetical protein
VCSHILEHADVAQALDEISLSVSCYHHAEVVDVLQSFLDHLGFSSSRKHCFLLLPESPNCCMNFVNSTVSCTLGLGDALPGFLLVQTLAPSCHPDQVKV